MKTFFLQLDVNSERKTNVHFAAIFGGGGSGDTSNFLARSIQYVANKLVMKAKNCYNIKKNFFDC